MDASVLAIPNYCEEWSTFLTDPKRVVTMLSRSFRVLALPKLMGENKKDGLRLPPPAQRLLKVFSASSEQYTHEAMHAFLNQQPTCWQAWTLWLARASEVLAEVQLSIEPVDAQLGYAPEDDMR